ncbi:MAG: transposase [Anaerolineales bacterium]|nr:transposase [Anaerolineales bacterium]
MCRALLVRYLNHWSLRQLSTELKERPLLQWFVGGQFRWSVPVVSSMRQRPAM